MLIGNDALEKLQSSRIAIFGVGGVGGYAAEAIARAGVGDITLVDSDKVAISNINRQIIATHDTVGRFKCDVMRERILSINPSAKVTVHNVFFSEKNKDTFDFSSYNYIIDAIDSLSSKIELITLAKESGTEIISAMGAGNKLDPTRFEVADISKTSVCPLARATRIALRKRGINHLKVVYSKEDPVIKNNLDEDGNRVPASISFVPSVMGLIIAGEAIKDIIAKNDN